MDLQTLLHALQIIAYFILGGLTVYFKSSQVLKGAAAELIADAEELYSDTRKAGGAKHTYVVDKLCLLIPAPLRFLLNRSMVEHLVDRTFQAVEHYARQQLDQAVGITINEAPRKSR